MERASETKNQGSLKKNKKILAVREACKAIYSDLLQAFSEDPFKKQEPNFCVRSTTLRRMAGGGVSK